MPKTTKSGKAKKDELPSTLKRSPAKAQRTFAKAHDSAAEEYGEGERAHRVAYSALKHSYEKVGDHWEAKDEKGPSDTKAEGGRGSKGETKGGVDVPVARDVPDAPALVARLWPDDVTLHRDSESVPSGAVAIKAELLAAEFGGRQYHVTVGANGEEFRLQADSATHGSWLRGATEGCPVLISFRAEALHVYSAGGEVALTSPAAVG